MFYEVLLQKRIEVLYLLSPFGVPCIPGMSLALFALAEPMSEITHKLLWSLNHSVILCEEFSDLLFFWDFSPLQ